MFILNGRQKLAQIPIFCPWMRVKVHFGSFEVSLFGGNERRVVPHLRKLARCCFKCQ